MTKVTTAQRNVLEAMANGKIIFTDYLGKFKLDNKTINAKTLYALLDARLIQYEPMVRSMEKFSITELGRSIVTPIAESIVETTPIVEIVETTADVATSELVATIAANLNTIGANPTFKLKNGTSAKAYKDFDETRNQWAYFIGYYEEGLGLYLAAEFAIFENLIARMEKLSSGNLSLWRISEGRNRQAKAYMLVFKAVIADSNNSITDAGMRAIFDLVDYADAFEAANKELLAELERRHMVTAGRVLL